MLRIFIIVVVTATILSAPVWVDNPIGGECVDAIADIFQMEEVTDVRQFKTDSFSFKKVRRDVLFSVSLQYVFSATFVGFVLYICYLIIDDIISGGD